MWKSARTIYSLTYNSVSFWRSPKLLLALIQSYVYRIWARGCNRASDGDTATNMYHYFKRSSVLRFGLLREVLRRMSCARELQLYSEFAFSHPWLNLTYLTTKSLLLAYISWPRRYSAQMPRTQQHSFNAKTAIIGDRVLGITYSGTVWLSASKNLILICTERLNISDTTNYSGQLLFLTVTLFAKVNHSLAAAPVARDNPAYNKVRIYLCIWYLQNAISRKVAFPSAPLRYPDHWTHKTAWVSITKRLWSKYSNLLTYWTKETLRTTWRFKDPRIAQFIQVRLRKVYSLRMPCLMADESHLYLRNPKSQRDMRRVSSPWRPCAAWTTMGYYLLSKFRNEI